MKKKPLLLFGSPRNDGDTAKAVELVCASHDVETVYLQELQMGYFDYEHRNQGDDFLPLAERMAQRETIILATPVYWYMVSAVMKTFLDRWSDLLTIRKDLGRALRGTNVYVIAAYGNTFPECFEDPLALSCRYMEMEYRGCFFYYSGNDPERQAQNLPQAQSFSHSLFNP